MMLRSKITKKTLLTITVVAAISYLVYREMDQSAQGSSAYHRISELNCQLISLSGRRVSQKQLDVIKQGISKLKLHAEITADDFCKLLQVESNNELLADRRNRDIMIIPDKIEIYNDMIFIVFTLRSGPFRFSSPSLWKFELFTYGYAKEIGHIRIGVEK